MNYLEQIKGFWIAQEVNQLGTSEIAMYFYLLEIWNKTAWVGSFKRNNYKVMGDLSIKSPKTLQSVRDKLQCSGLLTVKQRNGDANAEYNMCDLGKIYRGLGKGLVEGSGKGLGKGLVEGSGIVKINETKPNDSNTVSAPDKPALKAEPLKSVLPVEILEPPKPPQQPKEKKVAPKKEKEVRPFWQPFIKAFEAFWFNNRKGESFELLNRDMAPLRDLYDLLRKRAARKEQEWTESHMQQSFTFFLEKAYQQNPKFTLTGLFHQFNNIISHATSSRPTATNPQSKSAVQGSRAASLINDVLGQSAP